jgi:hypothetical protein
MAFAPLMPVGDAGVGNVLGNGIVHAVIADPAVPKTKLTHTVTCLPTCTHLYVWFVVPDGAVVPVNVGVPEYVPDESRNDCVVTLALALVLFATNEYDAIVFR